MIITFIQSALGTILIIQGLFLLFALAFNGSVGETFVNYSFFTSAVLMITSGVKKISKAKCSISISLGLASIILYLPMIWQRFNFTYTPVSSGIYFDAWVIAIVLISLICIPNKSLNQIGAKDAPPG